MTEENTPDDLGSELTEPERQLADALVASRPVPSAGFRGELGRRLAADDPGWGPRPERLRPIVALYVEAGVVLVALAALIGTGRL